MNVWAFNKPGDEAISYIYDSVRKGASRFGWSYTDAADLLKLEEKSWEEMNEAETDCYKTACFLTEIEIGDWIVHINVPEWGKCTAAKVSGGYKFDTEGNEFEDYLHMIEVDPSSIIVFDRNDPNVLPNVSSKLKLRGNHWHIYCVDDFIETIKNLKDNKVKVSKDGYGEYHLKNDIETTFKSITKLIHKNFPGKNLEYFIAKIIERMPNVREVKVNGSGWKSDFGADILVTYNSGLEILDLEKEEILVVQVKSYEGQHYDLHAVEQIKAAIEKFEASMGLIITTAETTHEIEKAVETLSKNLKKPISIISGADVAKFLIKYASDLIINI